MRKLFASLAAVAILAAACVKPDESTIEFASLTGSIYSGTETTQVVLKASKAVTSDATVSLHVTYLGTDRNEIGAKDAAATFAAGESETVFEVSNSPEGSDAAVGSIRINITGFPTGWSAGTKLVCLLTPSTSEAVIYSFETTEANLYESLKVNIKLTGTVSGTEFKTNDAVSIPAKVSGAGAKYVSYGEFKAEAGSDKAVLEIKLDNGADLDEPIVISVSPEAEGYIAGDNEEMLCTVRGIPGEKNLAGKWNCKGLVDSEELPYELWYMDYEQDFDAAPVHGNENFSLNISSTADGLKLTPEGSGEYGWYFREASMTPCAPANTCPNAITLGAYSTEENNMFVGETYGIQQLCYFELSSANCSFSKDKEELGKGCVSISYIDSDTIILTIQNYNLPTAFWDDASSFETEFVGFASVYKRAK